VSRAKALVKAETPSNAPSLGILKLVFTVMKGLFDPFQSQDGLEMNERRSSMTLSAS